MRDAPVSGAADAQPGQRPPRGFGSVQRKRNGPGWTYYAVVRVDGKPKWLRAGPDPDDAAHLLRQVWFGLVDPQAYGRRPRAASDEERRPVERRVAATPQPPPTSSRFALARGLGAARANVPADCTIAEFAAAWIAHLDELKQDDIRKAETCDEYARMARNVLVPALGHKQVRDIAAADGWELVTARMDGTAPLREGSKAWARQRRGLTVSRDRALREFAALRVMLGEAVGHRVIDRNPLFGYERRLRDCYTQQGRPRVRLTREQTNRLIEAAAPDSRTLLRLLARTGSRVGEAFALGLDDLDVAEGTLTINKSWSHARLGTPKSEAGNRTLRLPPALTEALAEQARRVDVPANELRLLFPSPRWGYIDAGHWRTTVFHPAARAAGLPEHTVPHSLRHAAACEMLRGIPERQQPAMPVAHVQATLGHASRASTEVYTQMDTTDFAGPYDVFD